MAVAVDRLGSSYTYDLTSTCGERSLFGRFRVTVADHRVVAGHVVGVIAAHERAIKILPKKHQLTGQLPLLAAMIAFTVGGLYLLFSS